MAGHLALFRATRQSVVSVGDSPSIAYTDPDARPLAWLSWTNFGSVP